MQEKYSVYSSFDLQKHKQTYTNYLEVIITPDGTVEYAVPSHSEKMISKACDKLGSTRQELQDMCPPEYYSDFTLWLSKISECCSVWNNFVIGSDFTDAQINTLKRLKDNGLYYGDIPEKYNERNAANERYNN